MDSMIPMLQILIFVIFFIMFLLIALYIYLLRPKTKKEESKIIASDVDSDNSKEKEKKIDNYGRFQGELTTESIYQFMEFDEIVDNMIVRKNGTQFIMVLQCNGVNYDLMSEQEKIAVEEGFVQFLNTLRFPIQLYIQSRTLNLRDIIATYKGRVNNLSEDIDKLDARIAQAKAQGNRSLVEKLQFERKRKVNVLEYGIKC